MLNLDPAKLLASVTTKQIGAPILLGLPTKTAPVPNFVIAVSISEQAMTEAALTTLQVTDGDLYLKTATKPGRMSIDLVLSENPDLPNQWVQIVATALQALAAVANPIASFGAVIPSLIGISANFAMSQIATLNRIKNQAQPVMLLNTFTTLQSISTASPFVTPQWMIESMTTRYEEADDGLIVTLNLREVLITKNFDSAQGILATLANEIIAPGAGNALTDIPLGLPAGVGLGGV